MVPVGHKKNLATLIRAAKQGRLAIVECQRKDTKATINVICAIGNDGEEFNIVPFAQLFDGNPYDELNPPNPDGGFIQN